MKKRDFKTYKQSIVVFFCCVDFERKALQKALEEKTAAIKDIPSCLTAIEAYCDLYLHNYPESRIETSGFMCLSPTGGWEEPPWSFSRADQSQATARDILNIIRKNKDKLPKDLKDQVLFLRHTIYERGEKEVSFKRPDGNHRTITMEDHHLPFMLDNLRRALFKVQPGLHDMFFTEKELESRKNISYLSKARYSHHT